MAGTEFFVASPGGKKWCSNFEEPVKFDNNKLVHYVCTGTMFAQTAFLLILNYLDYDDVNT
jgi:hypothetical protein